MLRHLLRFLTSRRVLAAAVMFMVFNNLNTWRHVEWQGSANFFCSREYFPAVPGPSSLIVTSHQTDCDTLAKESMTFVYLHPTSEQDASSNLILRYDGDAPHPSWIDPTHIIIHAHRVGDEDVGKLVAIRDGIHIAADFTDRSGASIRLIPVQPPASLD